jgi:hypothetical protein
MHKIEVSVQLHAPATLPLVERTPNTLCIGGLVGPTAGLDAAAKKKIVSCRELNLGRPAHSLVSTLTELQRLH